MMFSFDLALWIVAAPTAVAAAYLAILGMVSLPPSRRPVVVSGGPRRRFAIIVPAHNEAEAMPHLISSLAALDYPAGYITVVVVADNCTDDTAAVARQANLDVVERNDLQHRGKGYALTAGLARLSGDYDAVVFIDGDCTVGANLLRAFEARLERADVVQAYYMMQPARQSHTASLRELALVLVHLVRPLASVRLGGSAGLKGSGMCFSRAAIDALGWSAHGLAEDIEQHVNVLLSGRRVDFAPEATVRGQAPSTLAAAGGQHRRWEAGRLSAARAQALPLLRAGVSHRSIAAFLAAVELLVPPISIIVVALAATLAGGLVAGSAPITALSGAGLAAMALYLAAGFVKAGASLTDVARSLITAPSYILWKTALYVRTLVSRPAGWEPTRRD